MDAEPITGTLGMSTGIHFGWVTHMFAECHAYIPSYKNMDNLSVNPTFGMFFFGGGRKLDNQKTQTQAYYIMFYLKYIIFTAFLMVIAINSYCK